MCGNRAVFPEAWSRWEINTRLATPAQKRQGICHRTKKMPPDQKYATGPRRCHDLGHKWDGMGEPGSGFDYQTIQDPDKGLKMPLIHTFE